MKNGKSNSPTLDGTFNAEICYYAMTDSEMMYDLWYLIYYD